MSWFTGPALSYLGPLLFDALIPWFFWFQYPWGSRSNGDSGSGSADICFATCEAVALIAYTFVLNLKVISHYMYHDRWLWIVYELYDARTSVRACLRAARTYVFMSCAYASFSWVHKPFCGYHVESVEFGWKCQIQFFAIIALACTISQCSPDNLKVFSYSCGEQIGNTDWMSARRTYAL